jgi:hypothetical protein
LPGAAKSWQERKALIDRAYGDNNLSISLINGIIRAINKKWPR